PGVKVGDFATVVDMKTKKVVHALVADVGPAYELGEGSPALREAFGVKPSLNRYGRPTYPTADYAYVVFPNSRRTPAWPVSNDEIAKEGARLFEAWGGLEQLLAVL